MKNIILPAILLLTISLTGFAQQTLRGKLTGKETSKPLAGASVTFAGSGDTTTYHEQQLFNGLQ